MKFFDRVAILLTERLIHMICTEIISYNKIKFFHRLLILMAECVCGKII